MFKSLLYGLHRLWIAWWHPQQLGPILAAQTPHSTDASPSALNPHLLPLGSPWPEDSQRRLGQGKQFYGLKPYTPGDDVRRLDWAAYARSRHPHVRQYYQEEAPVLWWVVLEDPAWQLGHHQPSWHCAMEAINWVQRLMPKARTGVLWLGKQTGWVWPPATAANATDTLQQAWQTGQPQALGGNPVLLQPHTLPLPEATFRQHHWFVLGTANDPRLEACALWPVQHGQLQLWPFADPWWPRWQPALHTGLPCQLAHTTTPLACLTHKPKAGKLTQATHPPADLLTSLLGASVHTPPTPLWTDRPIGPQLQTRLVEWVT
jgi:hypothetical protein